MTNHDILGVGRNFVALTTRDLLEARDQFHWHLIHKPNAGAALDVGCSRFELGDWRWQRRRWRGHLSLARPPGSPGMERCRRSRMANIRRPRRSSLDREPVR